MKVKIFTIIYIIGLVLGTTLSWEAQSIWWVEEYTPKINPADFTTQITNKYFTLPIGKKMSFEAKTKEWITEKIEISILPETKIIEGVETVIYLDRVYNDGQLIEETRDYLAQHKNGDVWYFGEDVNNYEKGVLKDHHGTFLHGKDGAKAGIWMKSLQKVGDSYRQEYYKGEAEDMRDVIATGQIVQTKLATYNDCVKVYDWTPLDTKSREYKYYCPSVGSLVLNENLETGKRSELVSTQIVENIKIDTLKWSSWEITCKIPTGNIIPLPTAYLYFEYNSTAGDTGIHGMFDSSSFSELCVYDTNGDQILAIKPQNQLKKLTMAGIFFESREPPHEEISLEEHLKNFPEWQYSVRGISYDGTGYAGSAKLTHNIPKPPKLVFPREIAEEKDVKTQIINPNNVAVSWQPVTETLFGKPVTIKAYEVIIRSLLPKDPHGFSHDNLDIHMSATTVSLNIPNEFWKANTPYEFEVIAIEESGNQSITSGFFETSTGNMTYTDKKNEQYGNSRNGYSWFNIILFGVIGVILGGLFQKFVLSKYQSF